MNRQLWLCFVLAIFGSVGTSVVAAEQTTPPKTKTPNILFAIADDWGPHAGAYGTKWVQTPHFDRVAREGLLFTRMYTPVAKCAPSRASIITGRYPWLLKEAANHICYFPPEFKSWCEVLHEQGWFVGYTVKGWGPGVAVDHKGKPRQMTGRPFNGNTAPAPTTGIHTQDYAANFNDFLKAAPAEKPWCFWYGCIEPHRSYEYGSGVAKGKKKLTDVDRVPGYWPDDEIVRNDILDYAYEVEHFDRHLGRMLAELEKRGELSNTLVIVTSDHGMPFPRCKGNAYECANHVPFAVRWPEGIQNPGRVVTDFASFVDLAPTFLDVAGISNTDSKMAEFSGRSLTEIFRSPKAGQVIAERDHALIGKERTDVGRPNDWGYPTRGIIRDHWLYVRNYEPTRWPSGNPETGYTDTDAGATKSHVLALHRKDASNRPWELCFGMRPGEELYDLTTDPDCLQNLAKVDSASAKRTELANFMDARLKAQQDPRALGNGEVFDRYEHATKAHVGFYEKFMRGEKVKAGWIDPQDIEPLPATK